MTVYITRCPVCQQAFKTNEHVLALKGGEVRCGFCQSVFNAYEHLYTPLNSAELGQLIEQQAQRQAQMQRKGLEAMAALAGELKGFGSGTDNDDSLIGVRAEPRLAPGPVKQEVINAGPSVQVIEHGAKIPGDEKGYANEELEGNDEEDYDYEEESPHKKRTRTLRDTGHKRLREGERGNRADERAGEGQTLWRGKRLAFARRCKNAVPLRRR